MDKSFSILIGKILIFLSRSFNLGSGSTWPGHIALKLNKNFIKDVLKDSGTKIIVIAGTNGKTTTGRLITSIIREHKKSYLQNKAGANLINGLASALVSGATLDGKLKKDYLIFESDENALPKIIEQTTPDYLICLNLFRDQLDRYGEIDTIAKNWQKAIENLSKKTTLLLNADDPQIAYLAKKTQIKTGFFGLQGLNHRSQTKHGADTTYCPECSAKLEFESVFFSHLGIWQCSNCNLKRPSPDISEIPYYPLTGTYNMYNALAASLFGIKEHIGLRESEKAMRAFTPAFGRQETITYKDRNVQIFLSKNPTSFNESLMAIKELNGKNLLILLNDRIPDGLDVSWIWDIHMEESIPNFENITVSGDRCYDMGLRIKYCDSSKFKIESDLQKSLDYSISNLKSDQVLYVLPNYSAMLDVRKILTGRKIL